MLCSILSLISSFFVFAFNFQEDGSMIAPEEEKNEAGGLGDEVRSVLGRGE
jgi:hypothetical protein